MPFIPYFIVINLTGLILFKLDKLKAKKNQWRISERALLICALLGGSIGCYAGMHFFHHKTKHHKFTVGIPVIFFIQLGFIIFYVWRY